MSMNAEMDSLVYHFFQEKTLEEVELSRIEQFVKDFPYCSPVQLLLAKKYQLSNDPLFKGQASKAAVFFTNPHWLNGLLHADEISWSEENWNKNVEIREGNALLAEDTVAVMPVDKEVEIDDRIEDAAGSTAAGASVQHTVEAYPEQAAQPMPDTTQEAESEERIESPDIHEPQKVDEEMPEVVSGTMPDDAPKDISQIATTDAWPAEPWQAPVTEGKKEQDHVPSEDDGDATSSESTTLQEPVAAWEVTSGTSPGEDNLLQDDPLKTVSPGDANQEETIAAADTNESIDQELPPDPEDEKHVTPVLPTIKLRSILDNPLAPGEQGAPLIPIEPLYTVDYFASQGIKANNDADDKDRLSIKLRSFTDWLKTMKKIHPEKLETALDQSSQSAIQHIAAHSNEAKDVLTETMAEVYARQGLNQKAVEVYKKLSLLNPDKRVYFAAKISKLND